MTSTKALKWFISGLFLLKLQFCTQKLGTFCTKNPKNNKRPPPFYSVPKSRWSTFVWIFCKIQDPIWELTFVYLRLNSVGGYLDASDEEGARDILFSFSPNPLKDLTSHLCLYWWLRVASSWRKAREESKRRGVTSRGRSLSCLGSCADYSLPFNWLASK